jgi:hemerythrin superfamily protein
MNTEIPEALQIEHEELREQLGKAAAAGGKTGEAAQRVMKVLHPHILLEEEFAIPPLTLLPRLARGEVTPDMRRFLSQAETLKGALPRMLAEHKMIVEALRGLMQAAQEEGHTGYARYARKMIVHAQMEEEILYPASILVGEYLRGKLEKA